MKKIIVPIDFSECSTNAVRYACSLAKHIQAELLILYVHESEVIVSETLVWQFYEGILPLPQIVHEQMAFVKSIASDQGVIAHTYIVEGNFNEAVTELSMEHHGDLVVMGTEGITYAYTSVWGTHTSQLIAKKKIPVLVVPKNFKGILDQNAIFVFATDFKGIDYIPDFFIELTQTLNAKLHIFSDVDPYRDEIDKKIETKEFEYLKELFPGSEVTMNHTYKLNLIHAVEDFASKNHTSLIMMISHHRGFMGNLFHQSVTKQMALHTAIPFLAVPDAMEEVSTSVSNSGFVG